MNIYLVSRLDTCGYDAHDSFVCVAKSEKEAKNTGPDGEFIDWENIHAGTTWVKKIGLVDIEYLGKAKRGSKHSVVCASFNAG